MRAGVQMSRKKARYWNVDEVRPLPKRLYKKFYGEEYSDSWKLRFSGLSEEEKKALQPILEQQKFKEIYWVPEVDYPRGVNTPDLFIDDAKVEIKSVTSQNSIDLQVRKSSRQVGEDGWLILDFSKSKLGKTEVLNVAERRGTRQKLSKFAITKNSKLLDIRILDNKKDDRETADQKGVHDPRSPYISILPYEAEKVNKKISQYWQARSLERTAQAEQESIQYLQKIRKIYHKAAEHLVDEMVAMYSTYYNKDGQFNKAALYNIANHGSLKQFRDEMAKAGLSTYLPANYQGRMNRLELLNAQIWLEVKKLAIKEQLISTEHYSNTVREAYRKTAFDILQQTARSTAFADLKVCDVERILQTKFCGKNYSKRIWGNTDHLAEKLQEILAKAVATGQSQAKIIRELQTQFNVGKFNASRLIRTETNYFQNQGELAAYTELGIEYYEILATLDTRTSKICQRMDGKVFPVKDAIQGKNAPPFHPFCRTTIVPYIEELESEKRIMRDPETNRNKIIEKMTYEEWKKMYLQQEDVSADEKSSMQPKRVGNKMRKGEGKNYKTMASNSQNSNVLKIYTGRIINGCEEIRSLVNELYNMDNRTAQQIFKLMANQEREVVLANLNRQEALLFSRIVCARLGSQPSIIMRQNDIRHLLNSGHLTGTNVDGEMRIRKLSAQDLSEIKQVIKHPDSVIGTDPNPRNGNKRLLLEKQLNRNHRLILEVDKRTGQLRVVTYFNIRRRNRR